MKAIKYFLLVLVLLPCVAFSAPGLENLPQTPQETVGVLSAAVREVLSLIDTESQQKPLEIEKIVLGKISYLFDFNRITALAVGFPWKTATLEQKIRLREAFKKNLIDSYCHALFSIKGVRVEIDPTPLIRDAGQEVIINLIASAPGLKNAHNLSIAYFFYRTEKGYRIYNVQVQGMSLVTAYRGKFNEIIRNKGIEGLITALELPSMPVLSQTVGEEVENNEAVNPSNQSTISDFQFSKQDLCYYQKAVNPRLWLDWVLQGACTISDNLEEQVP
ncbi:MAG: ABC transporter substrate-binding protein [Neisseriaceae bacterium]